MQRGILYITIDYTKVVIYAEKEDFIKRLVELLTSKGVSARDMSLS